MKASSSSLVGTTINRWVVVEEVQKSSNRARNYLCVCLCGESEPRIVSSENLKRGTSKSCGCLRKEVLSVFEDLSGRTFYNWTVIKYSRKEKNVIKWLCQCSCGSKPKEVTGFHLVDGSSHSCGCSVESYVATELKYYLWKKYNSISEYQKIFNPITGFPLYYDVFIPQYKIFIEVHGGQHYSYMQYFHKTKKGYEDSVYRDLIKKEYAEKNGIYLEIDLRKVKEISGAIDLVENLIRRII
jgi:hypothetical protein